MTTSTHPLVQRQMIDKNGHMVTRWVRVLETGEPALNIPVPQSPALKQFAKTSFDKLFPDFDEESGYLIDVFGAHCYYTEVFSAHALEVLPPRTLRQLSESLNDDASTGQCFLSRSAYDYLACVYEHGQEEDAQKHYEAGLRILNNAMVFREALDNLAVAEDCRLVVEDYQSILLEELDKYEDPKKIRPRVNYEPPPTEVDYGKLPRRQQKEAIAFVIATRLMKKVPKKGASPELVKLVLDNFDRQQDLIRLAAKRGVEDVALLKELMEADVLALTDGML